MSTNDRGPGYQHLVNEESVILDITEALCEGMNERRMNREEVAAAAGIHPGALQRELEGTARIPLRDLIRVAGVLGLRPKLVPQPDRRSGTGERRPTPGSH